MRNSDKWVRWNDRDDLQERFAILTIYPCRGGYYSRNLDIGRYIFLLHTRSIPDERIEQVKEKAIINLKAFCNVEWRIPNKAGDWKTVDVIYSIEFPTINELSREDGKDAMRLKRDDYTRRLPSYFVTSIGNALADVEDIDRYEYELAAAGAAQPSTVDADAEQTAPAALEHVTVATSSTDKESEGKWIRADVWAEKYSGDSKTKRELILKRLSKAREQSVETRRKYKGYDIYKDRDGREYYKASLKFCFYNEAHLEKDVEILTR